MIYELNNNGKLWNTTIKIWDIGAFGGGAWYESNGFNDLVNLTVCYSVLKLSI